MNFRTNGSGGPLMGLFITKRHEQEMEQEVTTRVQKATTGLSDLVVQMANDTSLGIYRIQEHVHKKVPEIMQPRFETYSEEWIVSTVLLDAQSTSTKSLHCIVRRRMHHNNIVRVYTAF
ncbi:hypothetical protein BATDEDRAFT_21407 [Batrachochytrium dendrobatidis JAM81]|uniref:Uncharacterized protein n=1 Tax=Batrachochytrium dendrobatidis (strain JAM81 / FGSC 10211) TaxID=684364 RepID=F4NSW4_BATDJ|nr:uncharacterized protein BATDEDRAFT_21407 [Batrachochytrium dendrobatidis JAM81]EGF83865.1 hypothetical protein BATDEDRAFT_21407 [Batrachochytrium dendrobatidis JAM81]|eukprot:XP_006675279.1 hypothetical protein BATDEDRAFT_21407 [Batrachochytrium dendrobatidis JAM81]